MQRFFKKNNTFQDINNKIVEILVEFTQKRTKLKNVHQLLKPITQELEKNKEKKLSAQLKDVAGTINLRKEPKPTDLEKNIVTLFHRLSARIESYEQASIDNRNKKKYPQLLKQYDYFATYVNYALSSSTLKESQKHFDHYINHHMYFPVGVDVPTTPKGPAEIKMAKAGFVIGLACLALAAGAWLLSLPVAATIAAAVIGFLAVASSMLYLCSPKQYNFETMKQIELGVLQDLYQLAEEKEGPAATNDEQETRGAMRL